MNLGLDPDELAACVACGLCLPHCPTWRVTGDESRSPRGRIATMRAVDDGSLEVDADVMAAVDSCVQCRGCETACPSAVPFGHLMEGTRAALADQLGARYVPRWRRLLLATLGHHRLVLAGSTALAAAQRTGLVPSARLGLPRRLPLRRRPLTPSGADVWLFTGCVMDAWQRPVHRAVQQVLEASGLGVGLLPPSAACCGALEAHAGLRAAARRRAAAVVRSVPPAGAVVVDSAGCGAQLKEVGELVGTARAAAVAARVVDVHELLAQRLDALPRPARPLPLRVAVQDPCHLRHVQRAHDPVRAVLAPFVAEVVELDDDGLCCGAGGAYAAQEPALARAIRERKLAAVDRAAPDVVASANPGCAIHLANAGLPVRHPVELVAEALGLR